MLLRLAPDCLVDFDVNDIIYDLDKCTVETGALENIGVACILVGTGFKRFGGKSLPHGVLTCDSK